MSQIGESLKTVVFISLSLIGTVMLAQQTESLHFSFGINHTAISNNQYSVYSGGRGGGNSVNYSGIINKPGVIGGLKFVKEYPSKFDLTFGANIVIERFGVDEIEETISGLGYNISQVTQSLSSSSVMINLSLMFSYNVPTSGIGISAGIAFDIGMVPMGEIVGTETSYGELGGDFGQEFMEFDPPMVVSVAEEHDLDYDLFWVIGVSYELDEKTTVGLNYLKGLTKNIYPFRNNRIELFVSRKFRTFMR